MVQNEQVVGRSGLHAAGRHVEAEGHTGQLTSFLGENIRRCAATWSRARARTQAITHRQSHTGSNTGTRSTATDSRSESSSEQGGKRADSESRSADTHCVWWQAATESAVARTRIYTGGRCRTRLAATRPQRPRRRAHSYFHLRASRAVAAGANSRAMTRPPRHCMPLYRLCVCLVFQ